MKTQKLPQITGIALALFLALAVAVPSLADVTSLSDPSGDVVGTHPDIVSVTAGHTKGGKLRHTIVADQTFQTPDAPCLAIRAVYPGTLDYYMCGDGKVHKESNDDIVGDATVTRPDQKTIVYAFTRKAIGASTAYRWRAESRANVCPADKCDVAPDTFEMHEQIMTYEQWAIGLMGELGVHNCEANRIVLLAWEANEGTTAVFNPLATTYKLKGSTDFNSSGVQNYVSLAQGVKAVRLTIENGWKTYGYGLIVKRLKACATALKTAKAIRASSWCSGCSSGHYVTGLVDDVKRSYDTYASKLISTRPPTHAPQPAVPAHTVPY